jgi:hypothetical protein
MSESKREGDGRVDLPWSLKDLESMVSEAAFLLFHLKTYVANIRVQSPKGREVSEDLVRRLELKFPSELAFGPGEEWGVVYPMSISLKREAGKFILVLVRSPFSSGHKQKHSGTQDCNPYCG